MPGCHHFQRPCPVLVRVLDRTQYRHLHAWLSPLPRPCPVFVRQIDRTKCRNLHAWLSSLPPTVSCSCTGDRQDSMSASACLAVTTSTDRVLSLYERQTGLNVGICMPGCHHFHRPGPVLVRQIDRTQCRNLHAWLSPLPPTVSRPCAGDRQDSMSESACLAVTTFTDRVPSLYGR
jgi:hypothetical protein